MTGKYTVLREFMSTPIILKPGLPSLGNRFISVKIVCDVLFVGFWIFYVKQIYEFEIVFRELKTEQKHEMSCLILN